MTTTRKNFLVPKQESYLCDNCRTKVKGGKYHNHCPHCLWSKHLDENLPGDRQSSCRGLMEPIGITTKHSRVRLIHRCLKCHKQTVVDTKPEDNQELISQLSQRPVPKPYSFEL